MHPVLAQGGAAVWRPARPLSGILLGPCRQQPTRVQALVQRAGAPPACVLL